MTPWQHWQQRHPERVALCLEEGTLTWRELNQRVQQYANAIAESGLNRADVLTLVGKNHPQTLFWLLGAMQLGVVCALTMSQPAAQLRSKLSALYRDEQCANVWLAPSAGLTLDELGEVNALSLPSSPSTHAGSVYHRDNLATLIFTSGSTGTPKAVAHTHAQHLASAQGCWPNLNFNPMTPGCSACRSIMSRGWRLFIAGWRRGRASKLVVANWRRILRGSHTRRWCPLN